MEYTEDLIKKAYKKLKCSVYFDKTQLLLRQQIVEFEDGNIDAKLKKIETALEDQKEWEKMQEAILTSISFKVFPKSLAGPQNIIRADDAGKETQEDAKTVSLVTNRVPEETQIDKLQYFIDMRVEGHILGVLWLLAIGWKLDKELYENSYGNRLRKLIIQELEKEDGKINKEYKEVDMSGEACKVIECIKEQGGRYGINVVTGTLPGAETAKLKEYNVKRYASFGALHKMREADIKKLIQKLLQDEVLRQTPDKYALLKLTPLAAEVAEGRRRVALRMPPQAEKAVEGRKKSSRRTDVLNSDGLECFEDLRALRAEIAREEAIPPYIVFSDKTLVDMCINLPFTREEMLRIAGVGEYKYEKYGEKFISRIKEFTGGIKKKFYFA